MSHNLEVSKILKHLEESKLINFDVPLRELASSEVIGIISASDEPWELICYTWVTYIHRGPISSIDEIYALSRVIQSSIISGEAAGRMAQRGG